MAPKGAVSHCSLHYLLCKVAGSLHGLPPADFEARMTEYMRFITNLTTNPSGNGSTPRQGSSSPPSSTSPQEASIMSRLSLWNNMCNNNSPVIPPPPEPQKEALNLEVREQQARSIQESIVKRESEEPICQPPAKRIPSDDETKIHTGVAGAHIKISSRGKIILVFLILSPLKNLGMLQ